MIKISTKNNSDYMWWSSVLDSGETEFGFFIKNGKTKVLRFYYSDKSTIIMVHSCDCWILHRVKFPAMKLMDKENNVYGKVYLKHNNYHRDNGPAITNYDECRKDWYKNGKLYSASLPPS